MVTSTKINSMLTGVNVEHPHVCLEVGTASKHAVFP